MPVHSDITAVIQQEETGCGIAAVANIIGLSYQTVRDKAASLGIFASDKRLYSNTDYVRQLLHAYGMQTATEEQPFSSWEQLPDIALLSIKYYVVDDKPFWHWVVFKRIPGEMIVIDSAAYLDTPYRVDFDAMTPRWFIGVSA